MDKQTKYIVAKFVKFITNELQIDIPFKVNFTTKRTEDLTTYAYYDPNTHNIKVYCKDRGLADVLRSLAHEFVHHHQNQTGQLQKPAPDVGGPIEDGANAIAGQLVKKFGYQHPDFPIYTKTL